MGEQKRVLLVDDDALVRKLYQEGLSRNGFVVDTAEDGLSAIRMLQTQPPDAVVLDLMMPRFTGVDVLTYLRGQPTLKDVPVTVLSNSYMDDLAQRAAAIGVQHALLKIRCNPAMLGAALRALLSGQTPQSDPSALLASGPPTPPKVPAHNDAASSHLRVSPHVALPELDATGNDPDFADRTRADFLANITLIRKELGVLLEAFEKATNDAARELRLQNLYRRVHFLSAAAGLAGCHRIAQMASAFEALLYSLMGKPAQVNPSILETCSQAVQCLLDLLEKAHESEQHRPMPTARILVVDDDQLANRLVVSSLRQVGLTARSTETAHSALQLMCETYYDLVLLDIEMPKMDGFECCRNLRLLPGYAKTPVIFVTSHSDFRSRSKAVRSGGNDLIAKPIFPMELAVKVVGYLLGGRAGSVSARSA